MESRVPPEGARPGPHPPPPDDLARRRLTLRETDQAWFRIHSNSRDPLFFGRSGHNRFDAPAAEYGILYAGADAYCAFIETFGHATGDQVVTTGALGSRALTRIEALRPLRLVDLTGAGLARLGADERLCSGDYTIAQRWSLALMQHPEQPDGLLYRSRHDPSRLCAAIHDRGSAAIRAVSLGLLTDSEQRDRLAALLDTYGFALIDTGTHV